MAGFPSRYVVFDTETRMVPDRRNQWDERHELTLGVAKVYSEAGTGRDTPEYVNFTTAEQFHHLIGTMPRKDDCIWIFSHNLPFDARIVDWFGYAARDVYRFLPPHGSVNAGRYKDPFVTIDSGPCIMRFWRPDGQRLMLMDSMNWFPRKLAELGRQIGLAKLKDPGPDAPDNQRLEYCRNDCDVLDRGLRKCWGWLASIGVNDWAPTPALAAAMLFRQKYNRKRIQTCDDVRIMSLDRHGYYGGQIEVYQYGRYDGMCYQLDVNGLYPSVMQHNPYPCEVDSFDLSEDARHEADEIDPSCTTAEVYLDATTHTYPVRCSDGVYHCKGAIRTILPGPELQAAYARGHVIGIGRYVKYKMGHPFGSWVSLFSGKRIMAKRKGDDFAASLCKIFLNSLHGKFGQRDGNWNYEGRSGLHDRYGGGPILGEAAGDNTEWRMLAGHTYLRNRDSEHKHGFVPVASWCTSYARLAMADYIDMIGPEHVLYQCVDSLIVDGEGLGTLQLAELVDDLRLGAFKHDDAYTWIDLKGINQYEHDHGFVHAGIKTGAIRIAGNWWKQDEWETLAHSLGHKGTGQVGMRQVAKHAGGRYQRRKVTESGTTLPWITNNWDTPPEKQKREPLRRFGPA